MSFTNRGLYRMWNINESNPWHLVNDKKIYFIHDTPHLIKLIRNNLIKHDFVMTRSTDFGSEKCKVCWSHIVTFYRKDKRVCSRTSPKLTDSHLVLRDFTKMKVKLAAQVFSHSVYAGMMTLCRLKILKPAARNTALFIRTVDEMFDFLNISRLNESKHIKSGQHFYSNFRKFDEFITFISNIEVPTYHT